jgi:hypothetical protein
MSENAEAERQLSQTLSAAMSVALNIALQAQQHRAERARVALRDGEERGRETEAQRVADRETAAVLWRRIDDGPDWLTEHPDEVAEAWASARAWETLDPRAAEARAKLDFVLDSFYGTGHSLTRVSRESADYQALASLLQRAVVDAPEQPDTRYYETVPEQEREAWLARQVWGPDTDRDTRIARSAQLDDLQQGLPVSVLREMPEETRAAWLQLTKLDPEERRMWRREWLERQVWGDELPQDVRARRAEELDRLDAGADEPWEPEAWHAFVGETSRQAREHAAGEEVSLHKERAAGGQQTPNRSLAAPDRSTAVEAGEGVSITAQHEGETQQQRLACAAAAVRKAWPERVAEEVVNRDAFGAMAHRLGELEDRGYEIADVLGNIPTDRLVGTDDYNQPVRNPAAFAEWHIKQLAKSLPERAQAEAGITRLENYVAAQNPGAPEQQEQKQTGHVSGDSVLPGTLAAQLEDAHRRIADHQQFGGDGLRQAARRVADAAPSGTITHAAATKAVTGQVGAAAAPSLVDALERHKVLAAGTDGFLRVSRDREQSARLVRSPQDIVADVRARADRDGEADTGLTALQRHADTLKLDIVEQYGATEDDHIRSDDEQAATEVAVDVATDPTVSRAERHDAGDAAVEHADAAESLNDAAGAHEQAVEDLHHGVYDTGSKPARLAGQGFPLGIRQALARASKLPQGRRQDRIPQARRYRPNEQGLQR